MPMKISFDSAHNPESPIFILARKNGEKQGQINAKNIVCSDVFRDASEFSFKVYKYTINNNGSYVKDGLWDDIRDFKLIWCKNLNMWFQIRVEIDESTETTKTVYATQLGHAELSQIMLYNIEINTEDDIARDEYEIPTVLYNSEHPEASLLHRIMEKAPHYSLKHVDSTIARIQRTFSFDGTSLYDAFQEIGEEIGCIFILESDSDENDRIRRTVSVYDIESNCYDCGHRGDFTGSCPKCGSTNISEGYGEDTTIFVTADELGEDIQFTTDTDSVKNCFKLEGGDDLMTATIRNCNPNGSDYIWYISGDMKKDMSDALVNGLTSYDETYDYYHDEYIANINSSLISSYNSLITKYQSYNADLKEISTPITGYPALMEAYYNTINFSMYLEHELMPTVSMGDTSATKQAALLTASNLSPIALENISYISSATADSAVLAMAKVIVDSRYQVKVNTSSLSGQTWTGNFTITNYSDEEDTATSNTISITITDNYKEFVQQKIDKALNKCETTEDGDTSITGLFKKDYSSFVAELKKYCLNRLDSFYNAGQTCIDILIEQGIGNNETWSSDTVETNLYDDLYTPYYNKLSAIEAEMKVRQDEINTIIGVYDINGDLTSTGIQVELSNEKDRVQDALNFETYLGNELWLEFCTYRREDKYTNDNYISDGLNDAELFDRAIEFIDVAKKEIYKSAELQHSISCKLKNLLVIKRFEPLVEYFEVGNWIRILVDDEVYKLRLIKYEIDFDNLDDISVDFSDVMKTVDGMSDQRSLMEKVNKMTTNYDAVQRQASQGESSNKLLSNWVAKGLDVTNTKIMSAADGQTQTWDEHGMLFRRYDSIVDDYWDTQLKIINSTLAITNDNWRTVKTAIGNYYYFDPVTGKLTSAYGVIAETIVGKLILGEELGIYNESGNLSFNEDGFVITNGANTFTVNPNSDNLLTISNEEDDIFYFDKDGMLHISGDGAGLDLSGNLEVRAAQYAADDARKVATNYLSFSSDGLIVGDMTTGTLGNNVCIDSDSVDIRSGTTVLASYGADTIYLGCNSQYSTIDFRNGSLRMESFTMTIPPPPPSPIDDSTYSAGTVKYQDINAIYSVNSSGLYLRNYNTGSDSLLVLQSYSPSSGGTVGINLRSSTSGDYIQLDASTGNIHFISKGYMSFRVNGSKAMYVTGAGNVKIFGTLGVDYTTYLTGGASINSGLTVTGGTTLDGLTVTGSASCGGTLGVDDTIYAHGDLTVTCNTNLNGGTNLNDAVYAKGIYKKTTSTTAANVTIGDENTDYRLYRSTASSRRYKTDINNTDISEFEQLYDLPVMRYKYKADYLEEDDEGQGKDFYGFIAEDFADFLPCALQYTILNGEKVPEMWNVNIVVPCMMKLIQDLNNRLKKLEEAN